MSNNFSYPKTSWAWLLLEPLDRIIHTKRTIGISRKKNMNRQKKTMVRKNRKHIWYSAIDRKKRTIGILRKRREIHMVRCNHQS